MRRSHRRQRERVVSKSHAISDGGGDVRRPRKPSHEKEGFEKEDRSVKEGDLFHHYPRRRRSQARTLIKSIKDNEEPFDFSKFFTTDSSAIFEEKYWSVSNRWVPILGRDFVTCAVSRDWRAREAALSAIESADVPGVNESSSGDSALRVFRCLVNVVARAVEEESVMRVYGAAVRAFRALLVRTNHALYNGSELNPILISLLSRCSGSQNKRIAELSQQTVVDMASSTACLGLDHVLGVILDISSVSSTDSVSAIAGRFAALDRLVNSLFDQFKFHADIPNENRLMCLVNFGLRHMGSQHPLVSKKAKEMFLKSMRLIEGINSRTTLSSNSFSEHRCSSLSPNRSNLIPPGRAKFNAKKRKTTLEINSTTKKRKRRSEGMTPFCSPERNSKRPSSPISSPPPLPPFEYCFNNELATPTPCLPFPSFSALLRNVAEAQDGEFNYEWGVHSSGTFRPVNFTMNCYPEGISWTKGHHLGSGAYGTCYQARDVATGSLLAVKQIPLCATGGKSSPGSGAFAEGADLATYNEVTLAATLSHPNTVRLLGASYDPHTDVINLFSEWMAGGSVAHLLEIHGPFTVDVIISYSHQLLSGVDYLHGNGIMHRDLKGANLLVDQTGFTLKIADFGAATRMSRCFEEAGEHGHNIIVYNSVPGEFKGQMQGTIAFTAPEVLRGEDYGRSSDVWSVGCCVVEMITTRPPWNISHFENEYSLLYKIARCEDPPQLPFCENEAIRDLASECLQLRPDERPTARQLLHHHRAFD